MRKLTQNEINKVGTVLSKMKDAVKGKRTDSKGNDLTSRQRRKIYKLTEQLGWNNNNARINGFVKKMFNVERIEWLDDEQCSRLIEMLKKMAGRYL